MNAKKYISLLCTFIVINSLPASAEELTTLDCLVKPDMYIDLSSPVNGVLESILVNKADSVKKGQVLAKLNATIETAEVSIAQQKTLMDNKIRAEDLKKYYAYRTLKRIDSLYAKQASSAQEQDDAKTEFAIAKTNSAQIRLDKKVNQLKLILAQAKLEQRTIKSPIDGIVVERYLNPGESVDDQPILKLAKINSLQVEVMATADLFGLVKKGMSVKVVPDLPVDTSYQATVSIVDRIIDAASGSFSIRLSLPNPDNKLVGGSKCIAIFPIVPNQKKASRSHANSIDEALPEDIKRLLDEQ